MDRNEALAVGGAFSIALHVALYAVVLNIGPRLGLPSPNPGSAGSVQVRMLPEPVPGPSQPSGPSAAPAADDRWPREAAVPPPPPVKEAAAANPEPLEAQRTVGGEGAYLPRSMLTVAPAPREAVLLTYPRFLGDRGWYSARVTLFIDESGIVRRVEVEDPDLPDTLQAVVRESFLNTPFSPGQVEGQAVRSRVRIEVTFGNRPDR